jgi:hypothetical protein
MAGPVLRPAAAQHRAQALAGDRVGAVDGQDVNLRRTGRAVPSDRHVVVLKRGGDA